MVDFYTYKKLSIEYKERSECIHCDLTVRTRSLANKRMYFVQFVRNLLVLAVLPAFYRYFTVKDLKLVCRIEQLDIGLSNVFMAYKIHKQI
jgi:hypothetical protein